MKLKKFALFMTALLLCVALVGCKKGKTYKITFDTDGGTAVADMTYNSKEGAELPTTTKENFKFLGWLDEDNKTISSIAPGANKNYNLKASWKQIVFSIEYVLDGGTMPATYEKTYNSEKTTKLPTPTKDGYSFAGWITSKGETITTVKAGTEGNLKLTAKWRSGSVETRDIQYNVDGGTLPENAPTSYEVGVGLATLPTPTKEGAEFAGWYTADDKLVTSISKDDDKAYSLTAKWVSASEKHQITFKLDGGQFPEGYNAPTHFFESLGLELPTNPTKEGFEFKGWILGDETIDTIPVGTNKDVTLTAKWDVPSQKQYYKITYHYEGGTLPEGIKDTFVGGEGYVLPDAIPNDPNLKFLGWYDNNGNKVDRISSAVNWNVELTAKFGTPKIYVPLWDLNQIGFDGNGMNFAIKVLPVSAYDPNDPDFSGTNADVLKEHQSMLEAAYNITVVWSKWDDAAPWGPERVKFINNKYMNNDFGDVYVVSIASQWIPTLVKGGSIAELFDINAGNGIFRGLGYEEDKRDLSVDEPGYLQDDTINEATSVKGKVYGYATGTAKPDYFMYYNVDKVKECNLEDPAELWLKGEWTLSKFDEWVRQAQNSLKNEANAYALDMGFAESIIGLTASTGNKMSQAVPPLLFLTQSKVTNNITLLQDYYNGGFYYGRGVQDVSPGFTAGTTLLHHGDLWFLKNVDRFNPEKLHFKIGVVPYPTADGEGGTPILSPNQEDGIKISDSEYLMMDGKYVTGVDMSESTFQIPYTGTACYAVLNISPTNSKNGITPEIITHILHDLTAAVGPDPNSFVTLTDEEAYRNTLMTKFDREIDVEVIMSCQGTTYFELMELLSMTVGGGSHFGDGGWWPLAASIVKSKDSPTTKIREYLEKYKQAMRDLGYNIQ